MQGLCSYVGCLDRAGGTTTTYNSLASCGRRCILECGHRTRQFSSSCEARQLTIKLTTTFVPTLEFFSLFPSHRATVNYGRYRTPGKHPSKLGYSASRMIPNIERTMFSGHRLNRRDLSNAALLGTVTSLFLLWSVWLPRGVYGNLQPNPTRTATLTPTHLEFSIGSVMSNTTVHSLSFCWNSASLWCCAVSCKNEQPRHHYSNSNNNGRAYVCVCEQRTRGGGTRVSVARP